MLGRLRVWGYTRDEQSVPIGFFVEPIEDERLPMVTLWCTRLDSDGEAVAPPVRSQVPTAASAEAFALTADRWFAVPTGGDAPAFRVGDPVLRGVRYVGQVVSSGPGFGLLVPFASGAAASGFQATLVTESGLITAVDGMVEADTGDELLLRVTRTPDGVRQDVRGALFTSLEAGVPGLWIGDVVVADGHGGMRMPRPLDLDFGELSVASEGTRR